MLAKRLDTLVEKQYSIEHLKALSSEDRRLRFGSAISDEAIVHYVSKMWDAPGAWFGIYAGVNETKLIALCHVAIDSNEAELGLSVDSNYRKLKIGGKLFERGVIYIKSKGIKHVFMHCLSENMAMKHMAAKAGMTVVTSSGETDARAIIDMPYDGLSPVSEMLAQQLAIYDNSIRLFARLSSQYIEKLWDTIPKPKLIKDTV